MAVFADTLLFDRFIEEMIWSIDGTFDVSPQGHYQLETVSFLIDQHVIPVFYALMSGKNQSQYESLITVIKHYCPNAKPEIILTDFEKAAMNAFEQVFPMAGMSRCMFHLSQLIQQYVKRLPFGVEGKHSIQIFVQALKALVLLSRKTLAEHLIF